jgi:hypothetical protein
LYSADTYSLWPPSSTGLFDQALTETLFDYIDFVLASKNKWYRVEGGMSVVTDKMEECINSTEWPEKGAASIDVAKSTPVVAMSLAPDQSTIQVTTSIANQSTRSYDMVFNTTALGPLQKMDLSGLNLDHDVLDGIRALSYDRATKVAIKFNKRWWSGIYPDVGSSQRGGGISSSDLPLGFTVYPSWDDGPGTNVLIVSYTWAQDAARMSAMVPDFTNPPTSTPKFTDPIADVCLKGLVKLFQGREDAPSLGDLQSFYITHHAWAWSHDPYTCGAFALFGPGQFENVWPLFKVPLANSRLAICGEAMSVHHAWISGALDSAFFSVTTFLAARATQYSDMADKAKKLLGSDFNPDKKLRGDRQRSEHPERDERLAYWCAKVAAIQAQTESGDKLGSL